MNTITITRRGNGFVLSVDGGSIECGTTAEVMSRVGHEMGMPFNKAQRQLFERMEAAETACDRLEKEFQETACELDREKAENAKLRAVIDSAAHDLESVTADRDCYKDWWYKLYRENSRLKEAICNAFVKEYAK